MSLNGSGIFIVNSSGQPVVATTLIEAAVFNAFTADVATALSTALYKDGQQTPTANIPMGGFRMTGMGAGIVATDSANMSQLSNGAAVYVSTVGGTADVITLTPAPAISTYAAGQNFKWIASGANTTNVTVNVSGLGAKAVTKNGNTALVAGDIPSGSMVEITYDGTQFIISTTGAATVPVAALLKAGGTMTGDLVMSGASIIETEGAAVTAASSTNIWATDGNTVHVTGNTGITDFGTAPQAGAWMKVIFDGTPVLTQSANLNLNAGGSDITIAAGDMAFVCADTTTQMDVFVIRKSGQANIQPAGSIVQVVNTQTGAYATTSVAIPFDDTIPQITEGGEFMTLAITPTSATNKLKITVVLFGNEAANTGAQGIVALFQDATTNALAAGVIDATGAVGSAGCTFVHYMTAGTTSATTFRVRAGLESATAFDFNGLGGARKLGGVMASSITIEEIKV